MTYLVVKKLALDRQFTNILLYNEGTVSNPPLSCILGV